MRLALAALVLPLVFAAPARAELVKQADNGFVVQHSVTVSTDPEATFAMLRTPAKWWDKDHSWTGNAENLYMDSQAGGCFCELIPNEATTESGVPQRTLRGSVQHMQIVYVDPGRLLRLTGALGPLQSEAVNGSLTFTLKPVKGGTRVMMDYVVGGFSRTGFGDIAPAVDTVMVAQLSRLGMALGPLIGAGGTPEADPEKPMDAASEASASGPEEDATEDQPSGSMRALVTDLAPDETLSDGSSGGDQVEPAPKATSRGDDKQDKAGTRPRVRPAPASSNDDSGR